MTAIGIATALSVVGLLQALAGAWLVVRFAGRMRVASLLDDAALPAVTVLKPLHGDEPLLEAALASVCQQDYPICQVVFGVQDAADTAVHVVRRLQARFPERDLVLVVDPTLHGPNRKVANLINMLPAAKHDVLMIADSDVHAPGDWLRQLVATLQAPGVGVATTLYTGLPVPGLIATLGAMQINQTFLPGALLARAMGRQDCLGASMLLRRVTLARIGGLGALVNHLADDNVLGRLVQRLGLAVALAPTVPATTVAETTWRALWRHELRWARTIRALTPMPFAASVLQYPLFWAGLTAALSGGARWAVAGFAAVWMVRGLAARRVDRALALANPTPLWLLPARELMSVAVMAVSYAGRRVEWRGVAMRAPRDKPEDMERGFHPR